MNFVSSLVSSDEREVDSLVVAGLMALVVMICITVYTVLHDAASWSPANFAGGAATLIASVAGGKTARDWRQQAPELPPPTVAAPQ